MSKQPCKHCKCVGYSQTCRCQCHDAQSFKALQERAAETGRIIREKLQQKKTRKA